MKISFRVKNLPPKKDGSNSMWRKGSELEKLKALRMAACLSMSGIPMPSKSVRLEITIHADPKSGNLDNFITGICDGLMAAHHNTPIDSVSWVDIPEKARPDTAIVFQNDSIVSSIQAERIILTGHQSWYDVVISGE